MQRYCSVAESAQRYAGDHSQNVFRRCCNSAEQRMKAPIARAIYIGESRNFRPGGKPMRPVRCYCEGKNLQLIMSSPWTIPRTLVYEFLRSYCVVIDFRRIVQARTWKNCRLHWPRVLVEFGGYLPLHPTWPVGKVMLLKMPNTDERTLWEGLPFWRGHRSERKIRSVAQLWRRCSLVSLGHSRPQLIILPFGGFFFYVM